MHVTGVFRPGLAGNIPPFAPTTRARPGVTRWRDQDLDELRNQQGAISAAVFDDAAALLTAQRVRALARAR